MFKNSAGDNFIDQIKFMADQGFTAIEDNGMMKRDCDFIGQRFVAKFYFRRINRLTFSRFC